MATATTHKTGSIVVSALTARANFGEAAGPRGPTRLKRLRKNPRSGKKDVPQGLKADVFSVVYGPTKVVP
jgi:hypothetical protein